MLKTLDQFITLDESKIKWSCTLKKYFLRLTKGILKATIRQSSYRPFLKNYLYFDSMFNDRCSQNSSIFPKNNIQNKAILCEWYWS